MSVFPKKYDSLTISLTILPVSKRSNFVKRSTGSTGIFANVKRTSFASQEDVQEAINSIKYTCIYFKSSTIGCDTKLFYKIIFLHTIQRTPRRPTG